MASRKLNMVDLNSEEGEQRNLARVLRLKDLILLGVGSTLGMGGYVLAGDVAKKNSGPGVIVSFLMAAIASSFSCLSYGEFAARVPKAGSAYTYTYICVNELVAFLIGWNLVLEYVIGIATVAKGLSNYIDALLGYRMRTAITAKFSLNINFMASYPDLLSFFIVIALTFLLTQKVRKSTSVNNIFTIVNLLTVFIVIISGLFKANSYNWNIPKNDIPKGVNGGQGGFFPFGFAGVAAGAAKCFYGFIGFDAIATTGEEAIRPKRDIPIAMIVSLFIVTIAYCGIGTVLTLMWPYYDQDSDAPFPYVYDQLDWQIIKWIVSLGVIFALLTSLIGTMYPLPRILYAMSSDGLLFETFSKVDSKNKTPVKATWISGVFAGVISTLFDLSQLIDMMSIGTLLAYSIVICCVLNLRFKSDPANDLDFKRDVEPTGFMNKILYRAGKYFNTSNVKFANKETECLSTWIVIFYFAVSLLFCMIITHQDRVNYTYNEMTMYTTIVIGVGLLLLGIMLARQPQSNEKLSYMVPFVPVLPCLGILVNIYLMTKLDMHTWIRFSIWLGAGLLVYMTYGRQHSVVGLKLKQIKAEQKQIASAENVVVTRL